MAGRSTGRYTGRRVTMQEAADELGLTAEAIRKRVQRGSMASDKGEDGRRYVYLDHGRDTSGHRAHVEGGAAEELVQVLRAQVEDLRARLDREQEANRENRRLLAAALERIPPQLEAPASGASPEPRETAQGATETAGEGSTPGGVSGEAEAATSREQPRSWWRRILGG